MCVHRAPLAKQLFFRGLSIFYLVGAVLHLLDLVDLRMNFTEMSLGWKIWTVYLFVFDTVAAIGLWMRTRWGILAFLLVSFSQLAAYLDFADYFGEQSFLIWFHSISLLIFLLIFSKGNRGRS